MTVPFFVIYDPEFLSLHHLQTPYFFGFSEEHNTSHSELITPFQEKAEVETLKSQVANTEQAFHTLLGLALTRRLHVISPFKMQPLVYSVISVWLL